MVIKIAACLTLSLTLFWTSHYSVAYQATEQDFERWGQSWDRLIPKGAYDFIPADINFSLMFDPTFQSKLDVAGRLINQAIDGEVIELAGFMVPTEFTNDTVTKFLLVPEAGQCIHVPPPPLNQTILVDSTGFPIPLRSPFEPVIVIGRIVVVQQTTRLTATIYEEITDPDQSTFEAAESGYSLVNIKVTPLDLEEEKSSRAANDN